MDSHSWPLVRWVLAAQALLATVSGLIAALAFGLYQGLFTWLGGLFAALLTLIFAIRTFSVDASQEPALALRAIYRGIVLKMILAGLVFALLAKYSQAPLLPMLIGFVIANFGYKLALLKVS